MTYSKYTKQLLLTWTLFLLANSVFAQNNWEQFRGPNGNGHIDAPDLAERWSEGNNVVWKTSIHDRGWSSPVIWENQIWVTTATIDGSKLFAVCLDKSSGKILHDKHIFDVENPQRIAADNSYATPTSVIDTAHVYVHYGTYGTACLNRKTAEVIWTRRDLNCDHEAGAGPASSPILFGDLFIVNVDGRDVQYVIALNKHTGKTEWRTDRSADFSEIPVHKRKAYSMPSLIEHDGKLQLVSNGAQGCYAYHPKTGEELWKIRHHGFSNAPRPIAGHGLLFTTVDRDNPQLWAIRLGGKGDITNSHIVWKETAAMPPRCSPLLVDELMYLINRLGIITCIHAKSGEPVWKSRLPGSYSASPIYANGRIYVFNENAVSFILEPGRALKIIHENKLAEDILVATPAVSNKALFIRTEKHLYRIENTASDTR
ncbi:MAG: quinonprotein alcohol dehydrogenase [Planctomycetaceae bacterium]|nr:quinonprotein alcohol dehydrogenase [Planctomycetaceae bacterium]